MKVGWQTKTLAELCDFQRGLTYAKSDEVENSDNVVLRATNIDLSTNQLDFNELKYINDKVVVPINKLIKKGSLLICTASGSKTHLGKVAYIDDDYGYAFGGFMGMLTPRECLDSKYLFYLMTSLEYKEFIGNLSDGANINNLKFADLSKFSVPYPSLGEQKRIVTILDAAFEEIKKIKSSTEENFQNVRHLFCSVSDELFSGLSSSCCFVSLGEIIDVLTDYHANGGYETLKNNVELKSSEDFAWMVRSTDFEKKFKGDRRYITKGAYDFLSKSQIFGGEIIMSKIGNAGKVYLMPPTDRPCSLAMNLFLLRLNETKASHQFIYRYLKSSLGEVQIRSRLKGTATLTITKESVRSIELPLVTLHEQDEIVNIIDDLEIETQRLEAIYQQKLTALDELKNALLQQAFSGEL